jgi:hypothetical protein
MELQRSVWPGERSLCPPCQPVGIGRLVREEGEHGLCPGRQVLWAPMDASQMDLARRHYWCVVCTGGPGRGRTPGGTGWGEHSQEKGEKVH